ncbi:PIG-L deacetylase family protein [Streptomyces griseorubiginosus]|uniref:PIG-L deacetylase family protein n=1 Tax=Streptomyces griseorubiginosus TaxID=67304 RepID=UPI00331C8FEA
MVAHPDDAELLAYGTLRRYRELGATVTVLCLTHGVNGVSVIDAARGARLTERERIDEAQAAWDGAGVEVTCLGLPDGALHPDRELISLVESDLIARECTTLITHSPHAANDHLDHLALGGATTNAAARVPTCHTLLYGEPHAPYSGFSPTVLVDITDFLDDKIKALSRHTGSAPTYAVTCGDFSSGARGGALGHGALLRPARSRSDRSEARHRASFTA